MSVRGKRFKKIVVALALAATVFAALPAAAEGRRGDRFSPEKMVQRMQTKLDLSEAQTAQMKAIFESHQGEFQRIKEAMKGTLTDAQRQALKEARESRKGSELGRPSPEERKNMMAELGVSEGQRAQMKALREQMKSEREAIKSEMQAVLTPEQQAKLAEMKAAHKGRRGEHHRRAE
jgi:periplasmic protein CpxP/Spy